MNNKENRKGGKMLTDGLDGGNNKGGIKMPSVPPGPDPRLVELVKFLARQAAEKDFAQMNIESSPD